MTLPQSFPDARKEAQASRSEAEIRLWLVEQLAETLDMHPSEIDIYEPFAAYGLSSAEAAILAGDLEDWLGCTLAPTLAWEYPTIEELSQYLANELGGHSSHGADRTSSQPPQIQKLERSDKTVDELVAEIDQLTDEDVRTALHQKK